MATFGRPFVKRFALCHRTAVLSVSVYVCPVCNVGVLWPNGWVDQVVVVSSSSSLLQLCGHATELLLDKT